MGRRPKDDALSGAERQRRYMARLKGQAPATTKPSVTKTASAQLTGSGKPFSAETPGPDRHDAEIEFLLAVEAYAQRRFAEQMKAAQRLRRGAGLFSRAEWGVLLTALDGARPYDPQAQRAAYDLVWARKDLLYLDKDEPTDTGMPQTLRELLARGVKAAQQRSQAARERAARRKAAR